MTLPNNYVLSDFTVIISGKEIIPKRTYEIRYEGLYLTRKLTTSKNVLIIPSTKKYKLKGKIKIEKVGEEIEEIEKIEEINIDKLPKIGEENKPKFDKERNLIDGEIKGNFIYNDKIYIQIENNENNEEKEEKEEFIIKYIDELIVRKIVSNNKNQIIIPSTKRFEHNENTIIYLGENRKYINISSLPKVYLV